MNNLKVFLDLLSCIIVILAFLFVGIYPYIQIHNRSLADKLKVWYEIAKGIVDDESEKEEKSGAEKKVSATKKLVEHASNLKVPVNKDFANDLIQHAYNEKKEKQIKY